MFKSLSPLLNRAMPIMMATFLLISVIQMVVMLHLSSGGFLTAFNWTRQLFAPLAVIGITLTIAGLLYETSAEKLTRRGLRRRKGPFLRVLGALTNRNTLEDSLLREQRETIIDADELAASLRARIIGQDRVCEDMAQQLRRRLALQVRGKPVGIFLLAGPPGTGKTYLAKQVARQMERPLLHFDMTQLSSPHAATQLFGSPKGYVGSDTFGKLTGGLKETPDAVVLLDEIEKAHPDVFKKFLMAWNDGYVTEASSGEQVSTSRAIFVLTSNIATDILTAIADHFEDAPDRMRAESVEALKRSGFAPEVLNRIDRIFIFRALRGHDLERVAALEIEAMIDSYGLRVETGGIDPAIFSAILQRQENLGTAASVRDLVRSIEDMISESLIVARQQGAKMVRLKSGDRGVFAEIINISETQLGRMSH